MLFVGDDDAAGTALTELLDPTDPIPLLDPLIAAAVGVLRLGALGDTATMRLRNDAMLHGTATFADPTAIPELGDTAALQWHRFAEHPAAPGNVTALNALAVPTLDLTDLTGPCRGEREAVADINPTRAGHQRDDAATLLRWLGAATTDLVAASPDRIDTVADDLALFIELLREADPVAESTIDSIAELIADAEALLAIPLEDWTDDDLTAAEALLLLFDGVFNDEPCAAHAPPDPFDDVPATSFALTDVGVLFDLRITTGTSPSTYSPSSDVTREQMAAFLARLWRLFRPDAESVDSTPFGDVDEASFAFDDVRLLWELGITTGTSPTRYSPDQQVTREQMAAFLARIWRAMHPSFDESAVAPHPFEDVDATSFAAADIALIFHLGVTTGTSPTTYAPDGSSAAPSPTSSTTRAANRAWSNSRSAVLSARLST